MGESNFDVGKNVGASFLQGKYQLNSDSGVRSTAHRLQQRTGDIVFEGNYPLRIQNYLDRLTDIINPPQREGYKQTDRRERNINMLKKNLYEQFVIKPQDIPEAYFNSIKRKHRQEGHGDIEIPEDYRKDLGITIINDQKRSLDKWIHYLSSGDAKYDDWLKYYAFRSVLHMGRYDKTKKSFTARTGGTISPFPDLNREALAIVLGDLKKQSEGETSKFEFVGRYDIQPDKKERYKGALANKNFSTLYALAIEEFKPIPEELLANTGGTWVTYPRGSVHMPLVRSIADYGTGWCLRGEDMAKRYLVRDNNDLHVYYSYDQQGRPIVPRVVMVINAQNKITEVRGVAEDENIDPYIGAVVEAKLQEHPDGKAYERKDHDMKQLTAVESKVKNGQELAQDDLLFLYEINGTIEGFGYEKDPRVAELRKQRNAQEDMPIVFACTRQQIARSVDDIRSDTKAYVGTLAPRVFTSLPKDLEYIYTTFPEGRFRKEELMIGGKTAEQIGTLLSQQDVQMIYAKDMLESKDFQPLKIPQSITTIRLKIGDLGFTDNPTTDELYERALQFGLDLCPAEVGPYMRLADTDQPNGEYYYIAMKPITDRGGYPRVFSVERRGDGRWLRDRWAHPDDRWDLECEVVFTLRK